MSEWISLKDKLPKEGKTILIYNAHSPKIRMAFRCGNKYRTYEYLGIGNICKNVTHWMPLPPPPQAKE